MPPGTALDLACGEGGDAVWLAEHGWDVTAVDFAQAALARGSQAAAERGVGVRRIQADVATWRPDQRYDLVATHFLHTPDLAARGAAVRTAWESTGGTLLIAAHDPANLVQGTAGGPPDPAVLYSPQDVPAILGIRSDDPCLVSAQPQRRETPAGLLIDAVVVPRR